MKINFESRTIEMTKTEAKVTSAFRHGERKSERGKDRQTSSYD